MLTIFHMAAGFAGLFCRRIKQNNLLKDFGDDQSAASNILCTHSSSFWRRTIVSGGKNPLVQETHSSALDDTNIYFFIFMT
jgi:hypothetical protein